MSGSYTIFDHTADAGLRIRGRSPEDLLPAAAEGLYVLIGHLVPGGESQPWSLELEATDHSLLLRDFLAELLFLFERRQAIVTSITVVQFDDGRLHVTGEVCRVNESKSEFHREIKAITYHDLALEKTPDGYEATVILDI